MREAEDCQRRFTDERERRAQSSGGTASGAAPRPSSKATSGASFARHAVASAVHRMQCSSRVQWSGDVWPGVAGMIGTVARPTSKRSAVRTLTSHCASEDDAARDAFSALASNLKDMGNIWDDVEPTQQREWVKEAYEQVEVRNRLGVVVSVGKGNRTVQAGTGTLQFQTLYVVAGPKGQEKHVIAVENGATGPRTDVRWPSSVCLSRPCWRSSLRPV